MAKYSRIIGMNPGEYREIFHQRKNKYGDLYKHNLCIYIYCSDDGQTIDVYSPTLYSPSFVTEGKTEGEAIVIKAYEYICIYPKKAIEDDSLQIINVLKTSMPGWPKAERLNCQSGTETVELLRNEISKIPQPCPKELSK